MGYNNIMDDEIIKKPDFSNLGPMIQSKQDFSLMIEEKAIEFQMSCMEILLLLLEEEKLAVDSIPALLTDNLRSKIESDAIGANLLKRDNKKKTLLF